QRWDRKCQVEQPHRQAIKPASDICRYQPVNEATNACDRHDCERADERVARAVQQPTEDIAPLFVRAKPILTIWRRSVAARVEFEWIVRCDVWSDDRHQDICAYDAATYREELVSADETENGPPGIALSGGAKSGPRRTGRADAHRIAYRGSRRAAMRSTA